MSCIRRPMSRATVQCKKSRQPNKGSRATTVRPRKREISQTRKQPVSRYILEKSGLWVAFAGPCQEQHDRVRNPDNRTKVREQQRLNRENARFRKLESSLCHATYLQNPDYELHSQA